MCPGEGFLTMKLLTIAAAALSLGLTASAASASSVTASGFTTVQLFPLPVAVSPLGTAVDNGGGSYSFPVTGADMVGSDITLFHEGSGLQVGPLSLLNFQYTLGSPLTFPITLFGDVQGVADDLPLFEIDDELGLSLTPTSAGALGLDEPIAIGSVTGLPDIQQVPEPATLLLLGGALAMAARRARRS